MQTNTNPVIPVNSMDWFTYCVQSEDANENVLPVNLDELKCACAAHKAFNSQCILAYELSRE